jgi:Na+-driven multidrug efflux pump
MTKIGIFSSGQMFVLNLSAVALVKVVAALGTSVLAAYGIAMRIGMVMMMPGMGFGNAAATLVGQNIGACRPQRAERAGWLVAGIYCLVAVGMSVFCVIFARPVIAFFNNDLQVVAAGVAILRWYCATFLFISLSIVLGRAMAGAGDTLAPMVITAISMLGIRVPLAWRLSVVWGLAGILIGIAASSVVQGCLMVCAFHWGRWKRIGQSHLDAMLEGPAGPC